MEYGNEEHLDLRQRKTRKLLVEALAQLLEEKSFQELSVTDICRRAMVHRTTFYAHFNDKQELLRYLLENKEKVISRESLLDNVWGFDFVGETNAVDVYIRFLRAKIDEAFGIKLIHTVRGVGYVIREENE